MKDNSELKRLIRIIAVLSVVLATVIAGCVFWVSVEITNIKRNIHQRDQSLSAQLETISPKEISREVSSMITIPPAKDGENGKDGRDGTDGKDAVSTNTVIEKQTIVQIPVKGDDGIDGKDAREMKVGLSLNGTPIWKWSTDRFWQKFETIEVDL